MLTLFKSPIKKIRKDQIFWLYILKVENKFIYSLNTLIIWETNRHRSDNLSLISNVYRNMFQLKFKYGGERGRKHSDIRTYMQIHRYVKTILSNLRLMYRMVRHRTKNLNLKFCHRKRLITERILSLSNRSSKRMENLSTVPYYFYRKT